MNSFVKWSEVRGRPPGAPVRLRLSGGILAMTSREGGAPAGVLSRLRGQRRYLEVRFWWGEEQRH